MKIYFVETEPAERAFFEARLVDHEVWFADALADVGVDAEAVSVFIYSRIDEAFLAAHPQLRLVATRSTGFDHIDLEACAARNVTVAHVSSYGENTVAEHTFALMLAVSRRLRSAFEVVGKNKSFSFASLRGFDLKNRTLGVIGSGRIGLHVIRIARAFDLKVLAFDTRPQPFMSEILRFQYAPLEQLLRESDILSLHIPLGPQTQHLLNRDTLAKCKPGVVVINTARGGLIDTDALIEALDNGTVGAAGLDVLEEERVMQREPVKIIGEQIVSHLQSGRSVDELRATEGARVDELHSLMRNSQLLNRPNVVFTPHVAFNSVEAVLRINETTVENILGFVSGSAVEMVTADSPGR